jgi:hypothetical protein
LFLGLGRGGIADAGPAGAGLCRLQHGIERLRLQPRRLVDREMVNAAVAADIDVRELAAEAGAAT